MKTNQFKNLYSLKEASDIWEIEESLLRKAILSNKLKNNIEAKKFGKQWIVTKNGMDRVYGQISLNIKHPDDKLTDVIYCASELINKFSQKYKKDKKEVANDFKKFNIYKYVYECYDYLHLGDINGVIKDIKQMIDSKEKYD